MDTALVIALFTTAATVAVAIGIFAAERIFAQKEAKVHARRNLTARVMETFDQSVRAIARPAFVRFWVNPDLEFALLTTRVLIDLPTKDRVIARWMQRQVQLMQLATTNFERIQIRAKVGEAMLRWQHREIGPMWFKDQIRLDPPVSDFKVPIGLKLKQQLAEAWRWAETLTLLPAIAFMIQQALQVSRDASHRGFR